MMPWMISTIVLYVLGGFLLVLYIRDTDRSSQIPGLVILTWPLWAVIWLLSFCFSEEFRNG